MRAITRPTGLSMQDWCDQLAMDLDQYGPIGKLVGEDWQGWGVVLMVPLELGGFGIPSPYGFSDWKDWAERVCEELA